MKSIVVMRQFATNYMYLNMNIMTCVKYPTLGTPPKPVVFRGHNTWGPMIVKL